MTVTVTGTTRVIGQLTLGSAFPGADVLRATITHEGKPSKEVEVAGACASVIDVNYESVTLRAEVIFQSVATAALPAPNTHCTLSSTNVINIGSFTDVINGGKWKYIGSGEAALLMDDASTGTVTFKRWNGISLA